MDRRFFVFTLVIISACKGSPERGLPNCPKEDLTCQKDQAGYEAVKQLHSQIDDNQDGGLNWAESDEFVRDDLKHEDGLPKRNFHSNDDFITVYDLWKLWANSEVYNWTTDDVITWLTVQVELPQYVENFRSYPVNGRLLPRLASNSQSFTASLGIKNPVHKQKLAIKATDLVLFGPPKISHNYLKDLAVMASLLVGTVSAYLAYKQHSKAQYLNQKVSKDLSDLQNAEDTLRQMQENLEKAQKEQQTIADDKLNLEKRLQDEIKLHKEDAERYRQARDLSDESSELRLAEEELMQIRLALQNAERRLEESQCLPLAELQQWLQLCYEIETKYFESKKEGTEKQLRAAKEMCEKIRKQKGKFMGAFRVAHTTSLDETDNKIMSVRASLEEIKMDMQERMQRWQHIEHICHFNIINNPGFAVLEMQLKRPERVHGRTHVGHMTLDDGDESMPSSMLAQSVHQPSTSDLSFRSGSSFALCDNSPSLTRRTFGHSSGFPTSNLPLSGLRSKPSRPLLNDSDSQESIGSTDRSSVVTTTSASVEKTSAVVFDLGDEPSPKLSGSKFDANGKLLESRDQSQPSVVQHSMTKSTSLPNSASVQTCSVPNSLSEAAISSSSNHAVTAACAETRSLPPGASSSSTSRLDDSNAVGAQDDASASSDSMGGAGQESNGKEKKKKFALFKRHKAM